MVVKVFRVKPNGVITLCRAAPENRGHGRCPHGEEHHEVTEEMIADGYLARLKEKVIKEAILTTGVNPMDSLKKSKQPLVYAITVEELQEEAEELSGQYDPEEFERASNFYKYYDAFLRETNATSNKNFDFSDSIGEFLSGNSPYAQELREQIGDSFDSKAIADLLAEEVTSMTIAHRWSTTGRASLPRAILSSLGNDMTRENYATSVLYFGGKCCYCGRVLSRSGSYIHKPSGEHITPISPDDPNAVVGGTRFGNMALACFQCNKDRGSKDLHLWLATSNVIKKAGRVPVLAKIKAFQKFAGYEEYTPEQTKIIRESIAKLQGESDSIRAEDGSLIRGQGEFLRAKIAAEMTHLCEVLTPGKTFLMKKPTPRLYPPPPAKNS